MSVRLFVGNLPFSAGEAEVRQHFAAIAEPSQVVLPVDRDTGRPRGFAFVDFDDRAVAEEAIRRLDGQPFGGRPLAVSEARPRGERPPPSARPAPGRFDGAPAPMGGDQPPREGGRRDFGPDKPARRPGRGGSPRRQPDRGPKGPRRQQLGGRMYSIDDDSRDGHDEDGEEIVLIDAATETNDDVNDTDDDK